MICDFDTGTATVIVPDDQLSLAIGKEGQNARLAARLTGWRIDIQAESSVGVAPEKEAEPEFVKDETLQTSPVETEEEAIEEIEAAKASSESFGTDVESQTTTTDKEEEKTIVEN